MLPVPGRVPSASAWLKEHAKYFLRRSFSRMQVPDRPWFDRQGTLLFEELLQQSRLYMEYGSGGSTVLAAHLGKAFISVESDISFSRAVTGRIGASKGAGDIIAVNIGTTGAWGAPLFTRPKSDRLELWKRYVSAPWLRLPPGMTPDLILIDGRFRIACALFSLMQLHGNRDSTILFDDYGDRRNYHVIERFAQLERMAGRMGIFRARNDVPIAEIALAFDRFMVDWR
ncbi:MAG TPA: hypothetical protein VND94_18370 [Terriglobia bacterium]|nr:hypothetical protein [Terriglobia bacterium]